MKDNKKYEIDMINGSIMDKLISFALPLLLSGILQLLFNAVDIIVVGQFSGSKPLAAVGSTSALISTFTNFFIGISLGTNVLAARFFASRKMKEMSETVHTSILFAAISGVVMMVVGIVFSRLALELMQTPPDVIDMAALYLKIYFIGMPFFMLYNYGAAVLRAVGDTKRPLVFLIIAGVVNAILNLILVIAFHLDVAGVAIATVISQFISCVLVLRCLCNTTDEGYQLHFSKLTIKGVYLKQIFQVGVPAGIQSTVINFSNVLLQSSVNSFGSIAMAGYTSANNLLGFLYASINSVTQACMSFTSQNYGVGKTKRMDRVLIDCVILSVIVAGVMGGAFYGFGPQILSVYNNEPEVIKSGMEILSYTTLTYFLCGLMDLIPGALRGMGRSTVPMILSIIGTVGTRIFWIYVVFPQHRALDILFISYPVSWGLTIVMQVCCFVFVRRKVHSEMINRVN
jgi:putative MATE family efflux protein